MVNFQPLAPKLFHVYVYLKFSLWRERSDERLIFANSLYLSFFFKIEGAIVNKIQLKIFIFSISWHYKNWKQEMVAFPYSLLDENLNNTTSKEAKLCINLTFVMASEVLSFLILQMNLPRFFYFWVKFLLALQLSSTKTMSWKILEFAAITSQTLLATWGSFSFCLY